MTPSHVALIYLSPGCAAASASFLDHLEHQSVKLVVVLSKSQTNAHLVAVWLPH